MLDKKIVTAYILVIFILLGAGFWFLARGGNDEGDEIEQFENEEFMTSLCPQDAKICADGSIIKRSGEDCKFAPCSIEKIEKLDKTFVSKTLDVRFAHPEGWEISEQIDPEDREKSIIIGNEVVSWKLLIYDNPKKLFLKTWFEQNFEKENNVDCQFSDSPFKVKDYYTKYVQAGFEELSCDEAGFYANANDNSRIVKVESEIEEIDENIKNILKTFEFVR